jgi:hypothetical protein
MRGIRLYFGLLKVFCDSVHEKRGDMENQLAGHRMHDAYLRWNDFALT